MMIYIATAVVMLLMLIPTVYAQREYTIQFSDPDGKVMLALRIPERVWDNTMGLSTNHTTRNDTSGGFVHGLSQIDLSTTH